MKKLLCLLAMGAACLFLLLPSASATTLTFDALETEDWVVEVGTSYQESGYLFTTDDEGLLASYGSAADPTDGGGWADSAALSDDYGYYGITLTTTDDSLFSLDSFEVSENYGDYSSTVTFTITATYEDGSTYSEEITTDGTFGFETYVLGDEFTGLVSVTFSGEYYQIDDLEVATGTSEVPLPLPLLLLGSGLLVTGPGKKRQV